MNHKKGNFFIFHGLFIFSVLKRFELIRGGFSFYVFHTII
ncbi:hypothetical protein B4120_5755 [Bacillus cereus]|uniref:Uncharacterized protein n=1 Tax=Bacillus cereus (strain G9842) TaxID=405531 RepID=B7IXS5_BACC2|nr:hypothetical protein BCG9842_B4645 [Bacillus cereus G9842]KZD33338.1 hypothetical protein B4081_2765 [Bacillus cereus]KZD71597.1 hypothetical protein B4120_5755 [Bacillus cereus]